MGGKREGGSAGTCSRSTDISSSRLRTAKCCKQHGVKRAPRQQAVKMYQRSNAVARLGIHARVGVNQELQQPEVALLGRHVQRSDTARRRGVGVDSRLEQQLHNLFSDDRWSQNHAASLGGAALGVKPVVLNRYVKSRKAA
jgi:hypothetical protein